MLAAAAVGRRARVAVFRAERPRGTLRFATITLDQVRGSARREPDVGPVLEWVTRFRRRMEDASRNQFIPPASERIASTASWRHQFGDHTPMSGHRNPFACFNAPDVAA